MASKKKTTSESLKTKTNSSLKLNEKMKKPMSIEIKEKEDNDEAKRKEELSLFTTSELRFLRPDTKTNLEEEIIENKEDLLRLAEDLKIPVNDIKKYFEEFQEISYMEQNGTISKSSFQQLFLFDKRYQGKFNDMNAFIEMLFKAFDRDSSGSLTFREFVMSKRLIDSNDLRDLIRFIFTFLDISHDKTIEKKEILIFLKTMHKASEALGNIDIESLAEKMFNDLDLNNDGLIDEEEFIEGVLKNERYANLVRSIKPSF